MTEAEAFARLRQLEDARAVEDLLYRIAATVDGADAAAWLDCFTADGIFAWAPRRGADRLLDARGQAALGEWFVQHRIKNPLGSQVHVNLHVQVTVAQEKASASSAYQTLRRVNGEIVIASAGTYQDRLERCADGCWRVAERQSFGILSRGGSD